MAEIVSFQPRLRVVAPRVFPRVLPLYRLGQIVRTPAGEGRIIAHTEEHRSDAPTVHRYGVHLDAGGCGHWGEGDIALLAPTAPRTPLPFDLGPEIRAYQADAALLAEPAPKLAGGHAVLATLAAFLILFIVQVL